MDNKPEDSCSFSNDPKQSCCCFSKIDWKKIVDRSKAVIMDPKGVWSGIRAEELSVKDLYQQYMFVLLAFPAVFGFIKSSIIGYQIPYLGSFRAPFFSSLIHHAVQYAFSLVLLYLFAQLYKFLSPKFGSETSLEDALKLLAFSAIPSLLGSVLLIVPEVGTLLSAVASIYALYILCQAMPSMTGVSVEKRIPFCLTFFVTGFLGALLMSLILSAITPSIAPDLRPPVG